MSNSNLHILFNELPANEGVLTEYLCDYKKGQYKQRRDTWDSQVCWGLWHTTNFHSEVTVNGLPFPTFCLFLQLLCTPKTLLLNLSQSFFFLTIMSNGIEALRELERVRFYTTPIESDCFTRFDPVTLEVLDEPLSDSDLEFNGKGNNCFFYFNFLLQLC